MDLAELKKKSPAELLAFAEELQIENIGSLRKQDMMFTILKTLAENDVPIFGSGVLEVLQNGKVEQRFLVVGGFAEVTSERCTVLADEATPFEQVTAEQLAEREQAAERELADAATDAEKAAAQKALAVAKDLRRAQVFYAGR